MPTWLQHLVVISLALACAAVVLVRRLRALAGKAPACDGCAMGEGRGCSAPREPVRPQGPIPPSALVRRTAGRCSP